MRTSNADRRRTIRHERAVAAGLTALVAVVLFGAALVIPLETHDAAGERREMTAFEVWREMLGNVPADVPVFLGGGFLTVLVVAALVATAYVVVAIARLPR